MIFFLVLRPGSHYKFLMTLESARLSQFTYSIRNDIMQTQRHYTRRHRRQAYALKYPFSHIDVLVCDIYRPPNSGSEYWDLIEQVFDNLCDSHLTDLVIISDNNSDMLKPMHANRIHNLTNSYNLQQLNHEPTHYTEKLFSLSRSGHSMQT